MTVAVSAPLTHTPHWRVPTLAVVAILATAAVGVVMTRDAGMEWAPALAGMTLGAGIATFLARRQWSARLAAADVRAAEARAERDRLRTALTAFTSVAPEELEAIDRAIATTHDA